MKYIILVCWSIVFTSPLHSQQGWQLISSGTVEQLNSIYFVNSNTGYTAGSNGTFLRTTNAGLNWSPNIFTPGYSFNNLFFFEDDFGIMTSAYSHGNFFTDGALWRTTNGGLTWAPYWLQPTIGTLNSLQFINPITGYGVGHSSNGRATIAKSTNGGVNWALQLQLNNSSTFWSTHFINLNTGYACGSKSNLFKTTNGGTNWFSLNTGFENVVFGSICFVNENTGFMTGGTSIHSEGKVYKTFDAGENWSEYPIESFSWSIKFVDESTGYIAGLNGKIYKTSDAGASWVVQESNTSYNLFSVSFVNHDYGFASGFNGTVIKTTTGGATGIIEPVSVEIPLEFSLMQNYPNPFNPSTNIRFDIAKFSNSVSLKVYSTLGKEVAVLVNQGLQPGAYEVSFNSGNLSSGIYFYELITDNFRSVKKMVLVR